jgi:2-polyprenyl-6-methoxyphenol hydroxylase-like FAD-dependent oxidoreductase
MGARKSRARRVRDGLTDHVRGPRIVVVGAGIGGLSVAVALACLDYEVVVLEQRRKICELGAESPFGPTLWQL